MPVLTKECLGFPELVGVLFLGLPVPPDVNQFELVLEPVIAPVYPSLQMALEGSGLEQQA